MKKKLDPKEEKELIFNIVVPVFNAEKYLEKCLKSIIVIKSTVLPSILQKIAKTTPKIIYNPEFLREKHADEDFINSEMIIFGGDRDIASKVSRFYRDQKKDLVNA